MKIGLNFHSPAVSPWLIENSLEGQALEALDAFQRGDLTHMYDSMVHQYDQHTRERLLTAKQNDFSA